jgi:hypothetical protein
MAAAFLKNMFYRLHHFLIFSGGPTWDRTRDLPVMSRWLYQLSYGPCQKKLKNYEGDKTYFSGKRLPFS